MDQRQYRYASAASHWRQALLARSQPALRPSNDDPAAMRRAFRLNVFYLTQISHCALRDGHTQLALEVALNSLLRACASSHLQGAGRSEGCRRCRDDVRHRAQTNALARLTKERQEKHAAFSAAIKKELAAVAAETNGAIEATTATLVPAGSGSGSLGGSMALTDSSTRSDADSTLSSSAALSGSGGGGGSSSSTAPSSGAGALIAVPPVAGLSPLPAGMSAQTVAAWNAYMGALARHQEQEKLVQEKEAAAAAAGQAEPYDPVGAALESSLLRDSAYAAFLQPDPARQQPPLDFERFRAAFDRFAAAVPPAPTLPMRATAAWQALQARLTGAPPKLLDLDPPAPSKPASPVDAAADMVVRSDAIELHDQQLAVARAYEQLGRTLQQRGDRRRAKIAYDLAASGTNSEWIRLRLGLEEFLKKKD